MIIIDFQLPQSIFNEYKNHNIAEESAAVIEETFFLAPIRMQVNGVELLQSEYRSIDNQIIIIPWLDVPLLGFAMDGQRKIEKACAGEWVRFDLPDVGGFLDFSPESENSLQITSDLGQVSVHVNHNELMGEFLVFVQRVKDSIRQAVPDILHHPILGKWIRS